MKHNLIQLITVILIATFASQPFDFAQGKDLAWGHTKGEAVLTGVRAATNPLSPGQSLRPQAAGETDKTALDRMMPKGANRSNIILVQTDSSKDAQKIAELMNTLLPLIGKALGGLGFRPYEVKYYVSFILDRASQMPEGPLRTIDGYVKALTDQSDVNYAMMKGERDYVSGALQASWNSNYPDGPQNIGQAIFDEIDESIDNLIVDKKTTRKFVLLLCGAGLGEPLELDDIVKALLHKSSLSMEASKWDLVIRYYDIQPAYLRSLENKLAAGLTQASKSLRQFKSVTLDLRYCDLRDKRQYPFIFREKSDIIVHRRISAGNNESLDIHNDIMEAMRGSLTSHGVIIFNDYNREIALDKAGIITPKCVREAKALILKMGFPDGATFISVSPGWIRLSEYSKNHLIVPWEHLFAEAGASVIVYEPDRHFHNIWEDVGNRLKARGMMLRAEPTPFQYSGLGRGGASAVLIADDLSHEFMTKNIRKARAMEAAKVLCDRGYLIVGWGSGSNAESAHTGVRNILRWITEGGYRLVETGKVFENYDGTHNRFAHDWVCYRVYSQEQGTIAWGNKEDRSLLESI